MDYEKQAQSRRGTVLTFGAERGREAFLGGASTWGLSQEADVGTEVGVSGDFLFHCSNVCGLKTVQ